MKVSVNYCVVLDFWGNECWVGPIGEWGDSVQASGWDENKELKFFESNAYHLGAWCESNKFTEVSFKREIELPDNIFENKLFESLRDWNREEPLDKPLFDGYTVKGDGKGVYQILRDGIEIGTFQYNCWVPNFSRN
jgi:hypothetical protein